MSFSLARNSNSADQEQTTKQKARVMNNDEKQAELKRLETLMGNAEHIRKSALCLAGQYLPGAEEKIVELELSKLDEEILENDDLFTTYETLIRFIVREIVNIGDESI